MFLIKNLYLKSNQIYVLKTWDLHKEDFPQMPLHCYVLEWLWYIIQIDAGHSNQRQGPGEAFKRQFLCL